MSETAHSTSETGHETAPDEDLFNKTDATYFDAEDGHAGNVIGKMLALFFLYTVVVMSLVAYWTFNVTN